MLVMTPQLQQAIKLLQLSNLELSRYVEEELERNPLLEAVEEVASSAPVDGIDATGDLPAEPATLQLLTLDEGGPMPVPGGDLDTDFDNVYADEARADRACDPASDLMSDRASDRANDQAASPGEGELFWATGSAGSGEGAGPQAEDYVAAAPTLFEHLREQLLLAAGDQRTRIIGAYLIDLIDETGYFSSDLTDAAENLGVPVREAERVLALIQTFDPTGIGARNLRECLALQLAQKNRLDPMMSACLDRLDLLGKRDYEALAKVTGATREDVADMLSDIRSCHPKPGIAFGGEPAAPVVPDIFVRKAPDGSWVVELNSETLPRVLVNQSYHAKVSRGVGDAKLKSYLSECLANANWLVKSLDQRARTIIKVSGEIVRQQEAFFSHGVEHLKPLNLRTIAEAISMHESTVSRVTSNKFVATPRGVFELKYFFTSSIASTGGSDAHSAEAVRHRIRELIEREEPDSVLSDDNIVDILRKSGIDIARRTVAKYREALHIPSSVQRRREKRVYA